RWLFDQAVCTLYAFCGVLFGLSSLASLTVLSAVCCLKVCYPAYGRCWMRYLTLTRSPLCEQSPLSFNEPEPPHQGKLCPRAACSHYGPEPYGTACCISWEASSREATLYILALFVFCYLLPCLLILLSHARILWTVRVSRRALQQH
ncbi:OPN5 protein, partial [Donacobius atricapilla]|nr:OPN5 protein [Donacobius atricapilla]